MSKPAAHRTLMVFARDPQIGQVKTRLIPGLGATKATQVYRRLLDLALTAAAESNADRHQLWLDQASTDEQLLRSAEALGFERCVQTGDDLGARMHNALTTALSQADQAIIIGSDCPEYRPIYLNAAFEALNTHDVIIGPANDGGYVLIGLKHPTIELFRDIAWGGPTVMATTLARLTELGLTWHELETLSDIDVPEDLAVFPQFLTEITPDSKKKA